MTTVSPVIAENYELKWNSHLPLLKMYLMTLFRNEMFADVKLISSHPDCKTDPAISAHKIILCSCSQFFSKIFRNQATLQNNNGITNVILPPELSYRTIRTLVEYMYNGESTVCYDILEEVLRGGEILQIRGLCNNPNHKKFQSTSSSLPSTSRCRNVKIRSRNEVAQTSTSNATKGLLTVKKNIAIDPDNLRHSQSLIKPPECLDCEHSQKSNDSVNLGATNSTSNDSLGQKRKTVACSDVDNVPSEPITNFAFMSKRICEGSEEEIEPLGSVDTVEEKPVICHSEAKDKDKATNDDEVGLWAVVKEEPIDWVQDSPTKSQSENDSNLPSSAAVKVEDKINLKDENSSNLFIDNNDDKSDSLNNQKDEIVLSDDNDDNFSPLVCEICNETFTLPKDWVKHTEMHIDNVTPFPNKKKQKVKNTNEENENVCTATLKCDLCSTNYNSPAEWVRHIQNSHTENELAEVNNKHEQETLAKWANQRKDRIRAGTYATYENLLKKSCDICGKIFPTYARMIIHLRTHNANHA